MNIRVTVDSCPRVFRHYEEKGATDDARALTVFLKKTMEDFVNQTAESGVDNEPYRGQFIRGMNLCFDLLLDKIEMGSGAREWPMVDSKSNVELSSVLKNAKDQTD